MGWVLAWCVRKVCSCGKTARVAKSLTPLIPSFWPSVPPHSHLLQLLTFLSSARCPDLLPPSTLSHTETSLFLSLFQPLSVFFLVWGKGLKMHLNTSVNFSAVLQEHM